MGWGTQRTSRVAGKVLFLNLDGRYNNIPKYSLSYTFFFQYLCFLPLTNDLLWIKIKQCMSVLELSREIEPIRYMCMYMYVCILVYLLVMN